MGWLRDFVHDVAPFAPPDPLSQAVQNTVEQAVDAGWGKPVTGTDKSGLDELGAGPLDEFGIGGDPNKPSDRRVGRLVGTIFAGYGVGAATGAGDGAATGAGEGATGGDSVGYGVELDSEAANGIDYAGYDSTDLALDNAANGTADYAGYDSTDLALDEGRSTIYQAEPAAGSGTSFQDVLKNIQKGLGLAKTLESLSSDAQRSKAETAAIKAQTKSLKDGANVSAAKPGQIAPATRESAPGNPLNTGGAGFLDSLFQSPQSVTVGAVILLLVFIFVGKFARS